MGETDFNGFPEAGISFLQGLQENNNKAWFEAHRTEYEEHLLEPARAFASEMADRLSALTGEPVEGKLFRIYRDVRFSKDKRPYKNHIGVAFGEAGREKRETPGFYFHLEPPTVMLGGGLHEFPKDYLEAYREVLADPVRAATARGLTETLARDGYELWGKTYKRVPKGFDAADPSADLLLHGGLFAGITEPIPAEVHSSALLDHCEKHLKPVVPLVTWLEGVTAAR